MSKLLPDLPNVRYVRVSDEGKDLNLFRLDGDDKEIEHTIAHMKEVYSKISDTVVVEFMSKEDVRIFEWKFISKNCVPWEKAKKKFKTFESVLMWN